MDHRTSLAALPDALLLHIFALLRGPLNSPLAHQRLAYLTMTCRRFRDLLQAPGPFWETLRLTIPRVDTPERHHSFTGPLCSWLARRQHAIKRLELRVMGGPQAALVLSLLAQGLQHVELLDMPGTQDFPLVLEHLRNCRALASLRLANLNRRPNLACCRDLQNLRSLQVTRTPVDVDMARSCPHLTHLCLRMTQQAQLSGLTMLCDLEVTALHINFTLFHLSHLTALTSLSLSGTLLFDLPESGALHTLKLCSGISPYEPSHCCLQSVRSLTLTNALIDFRPVLPHLQGLTSLSLEHCENMEETDFKHVTNLTNLVRLYFFASSQDAGISCLPTQLWPLAKLQTLSLRQQNMVGAVDDARPFNLHLTRVLQLPALEVLSVAFLKLNVIGTLGHLAQLSLLKSLKMSSGRFTMELDA